MESTFILCFSGLLGLLIGSFLNVVIYRLPKMLLETEKFNLALPHSHCTECKSPLAWYENIPLLSYALQMGKCRHCRVMIHWRYPFVEFLTFSSSLIVAIRFPELSTLIPALVFTWLIIPLAFIDIEYQLLPNRLTYLLLLAGLITNYFHIFCSFKSAIIGAVSGYLVFWLIAFLYKKIRKIDGLGGGDIKLLAALGAWLGWQILPSVIFFSSVITLIFMIGGLLTKRLRYQSRVSFGPFLILTGWLLLLLA